MRLAKSEPLQAGACSPLLLRRHDPLARFAPQISNPDAAFVSEWAHNLFCASPHDLEAAAADVPQFRECNCMNGNALS
jgi:hypothetical protein